MYCTSCGGKIPDDSQFCTICGQPLTQTQSNNQAYRQINPQQSQQYGSQQSQQYGGQQSQQYGGQQSQQYGGQQSQQYGSQQSQQYGGQQSQQYGSQQTNRQGKQQYGGGQNATAQGNSRGTMIAVIAICSLVIIAALAVLIYFKAAWKPTVYLNDYIDVSFSGNDGAGVAVLTFNQDDFYGDYADKIKYKGDGPKDSDEYYDAAEYLLYVYVNGSFDKSDGLSNGDKVTYKWNVDENGIEKNIKVNVDYDDKTFEVSGLTSGGVADSATDSTANSTGDVASLDTSNVGQSDPFQYVTVTFSGRDGKGKVVITADAGSPVESWTFVADKTEFLTNGDKVLVSVNDDGTLEQSYIDATGTKPISMYREYMVSGLTDDEEIDDSDTSTSSGLASTGDQVVPDSSTRKMTDSEVKALTQEELQTAINEIYARNGYKFKDENIYNYFCQYDWYDPKTSSQDDAKRRFNETENYNVELMQKYRD